MSQREKALKTFPEHLKPYITLQNYDTYSFIDHSVWRLIMTLSAEFFAKTAHRKYLSGLQETGISLERIPSIIEMDEKLQKLGWRAAAVSGFIPPAIFLEFLASGIMPIACEIRKIENIAYTPAPDIVHEAAGHAPIVADDEYNDYLRSYGEVAMKAIYSKKDIDLYNAIKNLSDKKENPHATKKEIQEAEKIFEETYADLDYVSEATHLARMSWWSIEYGLVESPMDYKIYGAGLLSSLGESYKCLDDSIRKVPFTLDCIHQSYDITNTQPQLFVTPNFDYLKEILEEYANSMAYRKGGMEGLAKAKLAQSICTVSFSNGVQVSGHIKNFSVEKDKSVSFVEIDESIQVATTDKRIPTKQKLQNISTLLFPNNKITLNEKSYSPNEIPHLEIGTKVQIKNSFQFSVSGVLQEIVKIGNTNAAFIIKEASFLSSNNKNNFNSAKETLIVFAAQIPEVRGGDADRIAALEQLKDQGNCSHEHIGNMKKEHLELNEIHQSLRALREEKTAGPEKALAVIAAKIDKSYPQQWLCKWEIMEIAKSLSKKPEFYDRYENDLKKLQNNDKKLHDTIERALKYLHK